MRTSVSVRGRAVLRLTGIGRGSDVDDRARQELEVMLELVLDRHCDVVRGIDPQFPPDRDVDVGPQAVAQPSSSHVRDAGDAVHRSGDGADVIDDVRLDAVEHSGHDHLP